jgi:hypothetical protein
MNSRILKTLHLSTVVLVSTFASGCIRVSDDGDRQVIAYELWVPLTLLLACLAAMVAGWFLRKASPGRALGVALAGFVLLVLGVPSLSRDRVTIDERQFIVRTGLWGMTSVHSVTFDDVQLMRIIFETSTNSRGRERTLCFLVCQRKSGPNAKVPMNNNMCEAALPYIVKAAEKRNIPVSDER